MVAVSQPYGGTFEVSQTEFYAEGWIYLFRKDFKVKATKSFCTFKRMLVSLASRDLLDCLWSHMVSCCIVNEQCMNKVACSVFLITFLAGRTMGGILLGKAASLVSTVILR